MEGVRGIASLLVFCVHYSNKFDPWAASAASHRFVSIFQIAGQAGVDLFFALSGYLIYGLAMTRMKSPAGFIRHRLWRIYPPFLAVLAVYLCLFALVPERAKWPESGRLLYVIQNALLLPGVFDLDTAITVAWSLSYELFFYLTVPFMALVMKDQPRRIRTGAILATGIVYAALSVIFAPGQVKSLHLNVFLHPQFLVLGAGMLAWEYRDYASARWNGTAVVLLCGALAATIPLANPDLNGVQTGIAKAMLLGVASFALSLAVYGPDGEQGWLGRCLCWRPLRRLGNISYSFYLVHSLGVYAAFAVSARLLPWDKWKGPAFWFLFLWTLTVSIALATVLFATVEKHFITRKSG